MIQEIVFRSLFILAFITMLVVRLYFQSRVLRDQQRIEVKEGGVSLFAGSVAALTSIVFGAEYILFPGTFDFAYALRYPTGLRCLGALMLLFGITLLTLAHYHLGRSFHSFVVSKEDHVLVKKGPHRWVRHPIYAAYLLNYVGGGLLAGNLILTFVPLASYAVLVGIRMGKEEEVLLALFGDEYRSYRSETGRLVPRIRRRQ